MLEEQRKSRVAVRERAESQARSLSPTKLPGILLTPGTATTRRKTVSFGNEIPEDAKKNASEVPGQGRPSEDLPGKFPSPFVSRLDASVKPARKTTLTETLENAREGKSAKSEATRTSSKSQPKPKENNFMVDTKGFASGSVRQQSNQDPSRQMQDGDTLTGDMTVDLNQPHSQSGRYWKSEYEQYHEQALAEMKKLIGYKQRAKEYAQMKDTENLNLSGKLKEYQHAIGSMEYKISQLSAQVALAGTDGNDDLSPELVKELARQTALSVQYKSRVAEFQAALEGSDDISHSPIKQPRASCIPEGPNDHSTRARELKNAREQLKEMASLKNEIRTLRQSLSTAERSNQKIQEENTRMAEELLQANLRLERHLENCEKRRRSFDEQRQKRDEIVQKLQNDYDNLKESAKSQRRDAEQFLKKKHEQIVELKKEVASLRGVSSNAIELQRALQKKDTQHDHTIAEYQTRTVDPTEKQRQHLDAATSSMGARTYDALDLTLKPILLNEGIRASESFIPVSNQTICPPSKAFISSKNVRSETPTGSPRPRSSHTALSELVNVEKNQPTPFQRTGPVQHTPLAHVPPLTPGFSKMSSKSSEMQLPSPESSLPRITSRAIHERSCHTSPGPSMFNVASSPPKAAIVRPRVSNELSRQKSNSNLGTRVPTNLSSSRGTGSDTSRVRGCIPPERAAAAKARLEQKQAEKKRAKAQSADKENVRN